MGAVKVAAAAATLKEFNPEISVVPLQKRLQEEDLHKIISSVDIVLDCTDNFATRKAINRACVKHKRPLVSGAAIRFDAQLAVFDLRKKDSPCYACLFPEDGEVEEVQCSQMGVFAPLTGVIGAMQAMEAIKLLAGIGEPAGTRLHVFDAIAGDWRIVKISKDPACPVCGTS